MFNTKNLKQRQQFVAKKSVSTNLLLFCINVKTFFPVDALIFFLTIYLFIFKHRHSDKQRTMVNEYKLSLSFLFFLCLLCTFKALCDKRILYKKRLLLLPWFLMLRSLVFVFSLLLCDAIHYNNHIPPCSHQNNNSNTITLTN